MFVAIGANKVYLGLGNRFLQSDDLVCIFYGSQIPVVTRRHSSQLDPTKDQYKVICQCYLDGWICGSFPLDSWWEEFEQRPDTFVLV